MEKAEGGHIHVKLMNIYTPSYYYNRRTVTTHLTLMKWVCTEEIMGHCICITHQLI